ncbi:MAG: Fic family protein [Parachlamydiaceae bacterium]
MNFDEFGCQRQSVPPIVLGLFKEAQKGSSIDKEKILSVLEAFGKWVEQDQNKNIVANSHIYAVIKRLFSEAGHLSPKHDNISSMTSIFTQSLGKQDEVDEELRLIIKEVDSIVFAEPFSTIKLAECLDKHDPIPEVVTLIIGYLRSGIVVPNAKILEIKVREKLDKSGDVLLLDLLTKVNNLTNPESFCEALPILEFLANENPSLLLELLVEKNGQPLQRPIDNPEILKEAIPLLEYLQELTPENPLVNDLLAAMVKKQADVLAKPADVLIGATDALVENLKLRSADEMRTAVREAVMAPISEQGRNTLTLGVQNLGSIDLKAIYSDPIKLTAYVAALASGSQTATEEDEARVATKNIYDADLMVGEWVKNNQHLNPDMISKLNECLTKNTENNEGTPGNYRHPGENVWCSSNKAMVYLDGGIVQEEVSFMCNWINRTIEGAGGDKAKIVEIAARTLSWTVSIHPFFDGNGRTSRMLANYVLHKGGLPPAILDEDRGNAGKFGFGLLTRKEHPEILEGKDREKLLRLCGAHPDIEIDILLVVEGIKDMVTQFGTK